MRATALAVLLVGLSGQAFGQLASNADIDAELQRIVQAQDAAQPQTGLIAAVAFPDGSLWEGASGWSDPASATPIRSDHTLAFASITKTFAGAVVMRLVEEGVLGLDDRVGQHVGPYTHVNAAITIRQLLGHESGVYNYTNHPRLPQRIREDLDRTWSPNAMLIEFVNAPVFFAGFGASYSNTNYVLTEAIVEAATGATFGHEVRRFLLDPAGLTNTVFAPEEAVTLDVPKTWWDETGNGQLDDTSAMYNSNSFRTARGLAGGMYSTAGDIARWAQALFAGDLLTQASKDEMLDFHALAGVGAVWTGYGLGIQQYQISGLEMWGHSGLVLGSTSLMVYSPEFGFSIGVVDNDARSNHFQTVAALADYLKTVDFTATAVEDVPRVAEVSFYPNPVASGQAFVEETVSEVRIFDLLGREVFSQARGGGLDLSGLAPGLYLYQADGQGGTFVVQ